MKNAVLRVSALGNRIYLGTISKKDPRVMNDSRVDFTDQCIKAMIQHMQGLPEGKDCYETASGRLIWEPNSTDSTESTQRSDSRIVHERRWLKHV